MKSNPTCRVCNVELSDDNWHLSYRKRKNCICKECNTKQSRLWQKANPDKVNITHIRHERKMGALPFDENKKCGMYLGVHVAERILSHVFNNVEKMPVHNPGFDFICNKGMKIDVKSSCLRKEGNWVFNIRHNTTADYFLCLAFDNREDLNPIYIWLLPGNKFNRLGCTGIRVSTLPRWDEYKLDIEHITTCCDMIRREHHS